MTRSITSLLAISTLALAGLVACGGDDPVVDAPNTPQDIGEGGSAGEGEGEGETEPQGDTLAPEVTTSAPSDGEVGVTADTTIVIQFSEEMDAESVIAAYSSDLLPADEVSFSWNTQGNALSITPTEGLAYAAGDLDVEALHYEVTIGATATDLAGNPLEAPATVTFDTLRQIEMSIPAVENMAGHVMSSGQGSTISFGVGDYEIFNIVEDVRGLVTFDLSKVPDDLVFESATFRAPESGQTGDPAGLGPLHIEPIFYTAVDGSAWSVDFFAGAPVTAEGTEINVYVADLDASVTDALANREARNNLAQYHLRYVNGTDNDGSIDRLNFNTSAVALELVWLAE